MTICTEREMLREVVDAKPARLKAVIFAIESFLADTPACDAEKAVLVKAITWALDNYKLPPYIRRHFQDALADPSPAAAALLAQGERLERAEGLLSRIQMLLNGDNDRFGAMHYFGQARPLYDGTRNDPVTDAKHYTMISWYLRAFQSVRDGRARAALAPGETE
jgi:hypothetical protein